MSEFELFFRVEGSKYGEGAMLNKYGDNYSIVAARESLKGGTIYKDWAFPQDKDRQPKAKAVPMGVKIGDRNQAIGILRAMLAALDKQSEPVRNDPVPSKVQTDDDIPF